jgi:hypothetical protein
MVHEVVQLVANEFVTLSNNVDKTTRSWGNVRLFETLCFDTVDTFFITSFLLFRYCFY